MFVVNGLPPKLMIVNIKTGKVEVEHELPVKNLQDPSGIHAQFRRARVTAQGTYLVSFLNMDQVVEYDKNFKEIWRYNIPSPWAAIRLKNGNTLITDGPNGRLFEVTRDSKIVWEYINPQFTGANGANSVYRSYRLPYDWIPQLERPKEKAVVPPQQANFRVP